VSFSKTKQYSEFIYMYNDMAMQMSSETSSLLVKSYDDMYDRHMSCLPCLPTLHSAHASKDEHDMRLAHWNVDSPRMNSRMRD
jgi:hypothetical protein